MTVRRSLGALSALTLLALSTTSALAVDGSAFAERLRAVAAEQGTPITFGDPQTEGETVILPALTIGEAEQAFVLGDVRFEEVSGSTEAGWQVERVPFADVDTMAEGTRTTATGMVIEDMTIAPPTAPGGASLAPFQFARAAFDAVVVERGEMEVARLEGMEITNDPAEAGGFSADFRLESFTVNTASEPASEGSRTMAELGYEQLTGDVTGQAAWQTESGTLSLTPLRINVEEAGVLDFAYTISGYTPEFVRSLAALQQQMAQNPESDAAGMAVIGLVSQLYLNNAELTFTDQSLTGRLLDYYAGQNNQTREQLVDGLVGSLPLALAYLNNPEFQTQVSTAVETFLRDPKVLAIRVAPPAPVPATQVIGAAMGAPQTLPAVLNLTVESNQ